MPGVTTAMMVALGKADIKTLEDLAYCAADDLDRLDRAQGRRERRASRARCRASSSRAQEAEAIVMAARLKAGIVTEADLAPPPAAEAAAAEAEAATV